MNESDRQFQLGYVLAAAQVKRAFDEPTIAGELLKTVGVMSVRKMKSIGVEEFDLKPLRDVIRLQFGRTRKVIQ